MAVRAVNVYVKYHAWNTSTNVPAVGDAANHTLRWIKDNVSSAPSSGLPSEPDSNNAAGVYIQYISAGDADCLAGKLAGKSSTANVSIFGPSIFFEYLPNSAAGSPGGLIVNGTNIGGVTLQNTTGDALVLTSTGGSGAGLNATGSGGGPGIKATGGAQGHGIAGFGTGLGNGLFGQGGNSANGDGAHFVGGTGSSNGIRAIGGGSGGSGINSTATSGNTDALTLTATGTGIGIDIVAPNGTGISTPSLNVTGTTTYTGLTTFTGGISLSGAPLPGNVQQINSISNPASGAHVGVDWGQIVTQSATVNLSNTTIASVTNSVTTTGVTATVSGTVSANVVQINGISNPASGAHLGIDWGQIINQSTAVALSSTTIAAVTVGTNNDKTGYTVSQIFSGVITNNVFAAAAITAAVTDSTFDNAIADALLDRVNGIESGVTVRQAMRIIGASAAGVLAGATTATITINGMGQTTQRISASVDQSGNRTSVSLTP